MSQSHYEPHLLEANQVENQTTSRRVLDEHVRGRHGEEPSCLAARVLVISDALAERNGVGTYYRDLVEQLGERVERIELIAPGQPEFQHLERWSVMMPGDRTQRLVYPREELLEKQLCDFQPHVLILPTLGPYTYMGMKLARRHGVPVCVAHHTNFEGLAKLYWNPLLASISCFVVHRLSRWLLQHAASVATMSREAFDEVVAMGHPCVRQMGTPLGTQFLRAPRAIEPAESLRVLFLGRLAKEKGIHELLEAVQRLPHLQFTIGGDGPLRKTVEHVARNHANLTYLGWLDRASALRTIDAADLLVLPSHLETFGTVALEAMARQRLVLVSQQCGIVECPELSSRLLTFKDSTLLVSALEKISQLTATQREQMASKNVEAAARFNDATIEGWLRLLTLSVERSTVTSESLVS